MAGLKSSPEPNLDGLLLVDKPQGLTSHGVVAALRRLSGQKRIGHSGTLDPMATGLMQIMLGRGTKLGPYLTALDKTYEGRIFLGLVTDSDDVTGQVLSQKDGPWPDRTEVLAAMGALTGRQEQKPPAFSALKVEGRRAYALARKGQSPEMKTRPVEVYAFELRAYEPPSIEFRAVVSKGCYIRSLARDLGERLQRGGTLAALRRTRVGTMRLDQAHTLAEIETWPRETWSARLLSPAQALEAHLPLLTVDEAIAGRVKNGQTIPWSPETGPVPDGPIGLLDPSGQLLALYEFAPSDDGAAPMPPGPFLRPRRVLHP